MNSLMIGYQELGADIQQIRNGVLVAFETGTTTPYALQMAEDRGEVFVGPKKRFMLGK